MTYLNIPVLRLLCIYRKHFEIMIKQKTETDALVVARSTYCVLNKNTSTAICRLEHSRASVL